MSEDQTRPTPEWWQQQQDPNRTRRDAGPAGAGGQRDAGYQGNQDYQETQQLPRNQGQQRTQGYPGGQDYQGGQGFPPGQGYSGAPGYQAAPGYQPGQGYQQGQGYQGQGFPQDQGYQGQGFPQDQGYQGQGFPQGQGYQGPPPRVRRRRRRWPWITLIVIILLLVGADRAAAAYAENDMASQFQSSLDLSGKPSVNIAGFPFLTQVAARNFKTVNISASNETAGTGGVLEISSLKAVVHGMHFHGTNSATLDQFNASALVTFSALSKAGGIPQGITLASDGPNKIKANISIGPLSETAVAQVTQTGSNQINIKIIDAGDIPTDLLGNLANFNVSLPKLPAGVKIQSVSVTQQGLNVTASGQNVTVSQ
jgi:LmeA-like phospholipid-binding